MKLLTLACLICAFAPALAGQAPQIGRLAGGARELKVLLTPNAPPQTVEYNSSSPSQSNDLPITEAAPGCKPEQVSSPWHACNSPACEEYRASSQNPCFGAQVHCHPLASP
jgi:hypothetical protein